MTARDATPVLVRLTEDERTAVSRAAASEDRKLAEWCRRVIVREAMRLGLEQVAERHAATPRARRGAP